MAPGKQKYSRYYSGTDIRIYFGDTWVDEIVEIEFGLQEQVAPVYGYASYTWDKVARGNRFVQGQFSINFKEAGYLQTIVDRLSSKQGGNNPEWFNLNDFNGTKDKAAQKNTSVESVISNFQALADDYENAIWGAKSSSSDLINSRKTDSFFYGVQSNEKNHALRDQGFNILITYGQAPDISRINSFQTAQSIIGVQLTGLSTRIDPSGNPVQEIYSFIAKDLSGNIQVPM
ncbi:hypothetical protein IRB79_27875 (plasmid) [Cytobacillus oceanisediminis]|nr:hypothetical protein IRB79_27875 [Cytobacillus oceanisediminis]